jgi:hypothetical protein
VFTPLSGELVMPDARWIVGAIGLADLLLVDWIRAARRNKRPDGTSGQARPGRLSSDRQRLVVPAGQPAGPTIAKHGAA